MITVFCTLSAVQRWRWEWSSVCHNKWTHVNINISLWLSSLHYNIVIDIVYITPHLVHKIILNFAISWVCANFCHDWLITYYNILGACVYLGLGISADNECTHAWFPRASTSPYGVDQKSLYFISVRARDFCRTKHHKLQGYCIVTCVYVESDVLVVLPRCLRGGVRVNHRWCCLCAGTRLWRDFPVKTSGFSCRQGVVSFIFLRKLSPSNS